MATTRVWSARGKQPASLSRWLIHARRATSPGRRGRPAKTDRLDTRLRAELAAVLRRREDLVRFRRSLATPSPQWQAVLMTRQRHLNAMLLSERQRLTSPLIGQRPSSEAIVVTIHGQLDDSEAQMVHHVGVHFGELDRLLQSAGGIRPVGRATLIAALPDLGRLNRRAIAALIGVASMANESGSSTGRRRSQGRRIDIRRLLYMPALTATRRSPVISVSYGRQIAPRQAA